ncbi:MAG: hypothetical protein JSS24_15580, partial [Proteobacteria bacterium]|nr:hypothetical protein [Pseudomonadota bacterium]
CLGARGPLRRAITWKDARADAATAKLIDAAHRQTLYRQTGMPIDGRYLGPMFRYHWPTHSADVKSILSAKDFIVQALTGSRVTDPSTAAGYGVFDLLTQTFDAGLCKLWNIAPASLPAVAPAHAVAGELHSAGAALLGLQPGVPVSVGAADSVASAFAMMGLEEGIACINMGSSTVILDAVREPRLDPASRYLLTPHVEPHWYGREMDLLATGTGYRWLSELLGMSDGELDRRAAGSPIGARGLMFSPYLAGGEQGALWDSALRGAVSGLGLQHQAADLARAFLEGVGFEIRRCLEVLAETTPVRQVVLSGHLAEYPSSLQMLADILHRPIEVHPPGSTAASGAALGALQMLHALQMPGSAPVLPGARDPRTLAAPGADAAAYDELYARYLRRTAAQRTADADSLV